MNEEQKTKTERGTESLAAARKKAKGSVERDSEEPQSTSALSGSASMSLGIKINGESSSGAGKIRSASGHAAGEYQAGELQTEILAPRGQSSYHSLR